MKLTVKEMFSSTLLLLSHSGPSTYRKTLIERFSEYTDLAPVRITMGTWNINGGKHVRSIAFKHASLINWLLDPYKDILQVQKESTS